jgi:hypothetical protein
MHTSTSNPKALSSPRAVVEASELFATFAEALHHSLRAISDQLNVPTDRAYALITEEYGLRTRLGILRGDAHNRVVVGVACSQEDLLDVLGCAVKFIRSSRSVEEIGIVVNTVSVLCVSIFPGKHATVNFLVDMLRVELNLPSQLRLSD